MAWFLVAMSKAVYPLIFGGHVKRSIPWFLVAMSQAVYPLVSGGYASNGLSPGFWQLCSSRSIPQFLVTTRQ